MKSSMAERNLVKLLALATFAAAMLVASSASAQTGPLQEELDEYWSTDRDLPVIQEKLYTREGRLGVGVFVGLMTSEPFYWYLPVGGRVNYYFTDQLGLEVTGQFMGTDGLRNTTDIYDFLEASLGEAFDPDTQLQDRMSWRANATFVWNPLYGKWSFLNNKLTHFDANVVIGGGVVQLDRPNKARTDSESVIAPELVLGLGAHFLLSENWTLRADGRFYFYQGYLSEYDEEENGSGFFDALEVPAEFHLGTTYLF